MTTDSVVSSVATGRKPLTVLYSLAPPDGRTKYVDQIVQGVPPEVTIRFFTWRGALGGAYDVFHVHWPELTVRGEGRVKRFFRRRAADVLFVLLKVRRTPMVRTVHNLHPHEPGSAAEQRTLRRYNKATTLFIRLNVTTEVPFSAEVTTILHGHYYDQFAVHPKPDPIEGRLLYFGIIRPYKGVSDLIEVFTRMPDPELRLRIVGSPSVGQRELVERATEADDRITARLKYVDDADLVHEIGQAELVVLPYREMGNSGSILVAMSLARPVLAPASPSNLALLDEVGPGWIHPYEGELTPELIRQTLENLRANPPAEPPHIEGRDWKRLGLQHYDAYVRAIALAKGTDG